MDSSGGCFDGGAAQWLTTRPVEGEFITDQPSEDQLIDGKAALVNNMKIR